MELTIINKIRIYLGYEGLEKTMTPKMSSHIVETLHNVSERNYSFFLIMIPNLHGKTGKRYGRTCKVVL